MSLTHQLSLVLLFMTTICQGMLPTAATRALARTIQRRFLSSDAPSLAFADYPTSKNKARSYASKLYNIPFRSVQAQNLKALTTILATNAAVPDKAENPIIIVGHKSIRNALFQLEQSNQFPFDNPERPSVIVDHSERIDADEIHGSDLFLEPISTLGKKIGLDIWGISYSLGKNKLISYQVPVSTGEKRKIGAYNTWFKKQPKVLSPWAEKFNKAMENAPRIQFSDKNEEKKMLAQAQAFRKFLDQPKLKTINVEGDLDIEIADHTNNADVAHHKALEQLKKGLLIIRAGIKNL